MESSSENPSYLREVEIKFKKRRVKNGMAEASVTDASQVFELFGDLQNEMKEKLITLNLDAQNKIICFEVVAIGNVSSIYGRPMEAFRTSFGVNASGAIVIHNHPSGDPTPSDADKTFTEALVRMSKDMGMVFHDHVVIGEDSYFSFAEAGLLD